MTQPPTVHLTAATLSTRWSRSEVRKAFRTDGHLRRITVVVLSALSRTWIPFILLGALNRVFPTLVSVFFCYAGNARYAAHYSYPSCRRFLLWFPSTIGVFRQGRRWGLICATPVTEAEFTDPSNAANLDLLLRRLSRIKMLLGVEQLSFAGILPTLLRRNKSKSIANLDCDRTSEVVRRAVHEVRRQHFAGRKHTVVLLGGAGRIGQAVHERLEADGVEVAIIDSAVPATAAFKELSAVSMILVDVSRHGVIQRHIHELPEDTVVLNEVFPEPSRDAIWELKSRNIAAYHIAGVKAEAYPSLPHGYKSAVPCCAIHSDYIGEPVLMRIA
jgi:hypothetical protein